MSLSTFKQLVREQAMVMVVDPEGAVAAIPTLLSHHGATEIQEAHDFVKRVALASGTLNAEGKKRLARISTFYESAIRQMPKTTHRPLTALNLQRETGTENASHKAPTVAKSATKKVATKKVTTKKVTAKKVAPQKTVATKTARQPTVKKTTAKQVSTRNKKA